VLALAGCPGGGGASDGALDAEPDGDEDAGPQDEDRDGGQGDPGCQGEGGPGEACLDDCACRPPLACRGLPGDTRCLPPCEAYADCQGAAAGCAEPFCDFNLGACRCSCLEGQCGQEVCFAGTCVGCATDEHCASLDCTGQPLSPSPRCVLAEQRCACGGACGDGECDPAEASLGDCPADCPGPCREGARKAHSCKGMEQVAWCTCRAGAWDCLPAPEDACPGESACERQGGECVESAEACFDGDLAPDPLGCAPRSCCSPRACTGPGQSYYPYLGGCCPGLRAVPSRSPMPGDMLGLTGGMVCYNSCWALQCVPCGDGACQPWLGESFCTCPEDCSRPPCEFVCQAEDDCGLAHCRQEGPACRESAPRCEVGRCVWTERLLEGLVCDPVTRRCASPG
jgi:hypothetical protein